MYHYITNIVNRSEAIINREPVFNEAGCNRVLFIANVIKADIRIVSIGAGKKKGIFHEVIEVHSSRIKIIYLQQWHFTIFKKKLRHVFYSLFLFNYLLWNVKKNDKLIIYNTSKSFFMIMPVIIIKFLKKINYILELEELYSYKRGKEKLNFSETISIKHASAYIIVNNNMQKFIDAEKPTILNAGYRSFNKNILAALKESNNKNLQIIYSGRLDKGSGIEIFLESLKFITCKCAIVITGKGEFATYIKSFKNSNPLVDLKYLGILNDTDYHDLLLNTQIAVNPIWVNNDFTDVSFPSKILQYLSYGLQVVTSNIKALDILGNLKENLHIYENDSSAQMAEQINVILGGSFSNRALIIEKTNRYFENSSKQLKDFISKI